MSDTKKVFKLYGAWSGEKEALWLNDMSKTGWHLQNYCLGVYRFAKGNPENFIYEIDFSIARGNELTVYIGLYRDAGWEHIVSFANWHYFRAPADAARRWPSYSDVSSKKAKLFRVLAVLLFSIIPMLFFGIINPILNGYLQEDSIYYVIGGFSIFIVSVCLYAALRIGLKIKSLGRL